MNTYNYPDRISNIQILETNLNILAFESDVKKPYPSIKTLFYDRQPKNRKNLKKTLIRNVNNFIHKNGAYINKTPNNVPSIESIINNSKTDEFLSMDNPIKKYQQTIIIPIGNYANQNSISTLDSIKTNNNYNNGNFRNSSLNNINGILNVSKNNNLNKSVNSNDIPVIKSRKMSGMSNHSKPKSINLNDLYKEYKENVSIYFIIIINN